MDKRTKNKNKDQQGLSARSGKEKKYKVDDNDKNKSHPVDETDRGNKANDYVDDDDDKSSERSHHEPNWDALFSNREVSQKRGKNTEIRASRELGERKYKKKGEETTRRGSQKKEKERRRLESNYENKTREPAASRGKIEANTKHDVGGNKITESCERSKNVLKIRETLFLGKTVSSSATSRKSEIPQPKPKETAPENRPPISGDRTRGSLRVNYLFHDAKAAAILTGKSLTPKTPEDGMFSGSKTYLKKLLYPPQPSQLARDTPWLVNEKDAPRQDKLTKYKFFGKAVEAEYQFLLLRLI